MTETIGNYHKKKHLGATLVHDPSIESNNVPMDSFDGHVTPSETQEYKRQYTKKDRSRQIGKIEIDTITCSDCGGEELIQDEVTGDLICTGCGMVLESRMFFADKSAISFTNNQEDIVKKSSASARRKDPISEKLYRKLQKAEKWTHTWADIHQIIVKKEINRYIYQLEIPEYIAESAGNLYAKIYRKNAIQGRGIKAMVAATVYTTCRQHQIPVFFKDIESVSKQEHSTIRKCFTYIMDNFQIKLPVLNAKQFIPQLITKLQFSDLLEKVALKVLDRIESSQLGESINNPKHLASISIFFAYNIMKRANKLNISITQKSFSHKVGMSETTLRKYKKLFQQAISVR